MKILQEKPLPYIIKLHPGSILRVTHIIHDARNGTEVSSTNLIEHECTKEETFTHSFIGELEDECGFSNGLCGGVANKSPDFILTIENGEQ
jgi:hypothetical protein